MKYSLPILLKVLTKILLFKKRNGKRPTCETVTV